jgi:hypothetical protein
MGTFQENPWRHFSAKGNNLSARSVPRPGYWRGRRWVEIER